MNRTEALAEDASLLAIKVCNDLTRKIYLLREQLAALKTSSELAGSASDFKELMLQMEKQEAYS